MSYYRLNRQENLQKAKERYSKEKAVEYYFLKKRQPKKSQRIDTKSCRMKKKIKKHQRKRYQQLIQCKKEALKNE